ncbi:MAG TPA: hypothetical protein VGM11_14860 [Acidobacteriaceae bacterium]|jgi:hypothetical protein
MMLKNTENVVVVAPNDRRRPVGIARANDILQLRRWLMEEESRDAEVKLARRADQTGERGTTVRK